MTKTLFRVAAASALMSLGQAQAAAPPACLTEAEVHGLVGYLAPVVLDHVAETCGPTAAPNGYLRSGLPVLTGQMHASREQAWPQARSGFLKFSATDGGKDLATLEKLSDRTLRSMFDDIMLKEINFKVPAKNCADFEKVMEALAPLQAGGMVNLASVIFIAAIRGDKKLASCDVAQ